MGYNLITATKGKICQGHNKALESYKSLDAHFYFCLRIINNEALSITRKHGKQEQPAMFKLINVAPPHPPSLD